MALAPFSGSSPEWAARPWIADREAERSLAAGLEPPFGPSDGLQHEDARAPGGRARSMRAVDSALPISSSELMKKAGVERRLQAQIARAPAGRRSPAPGPPSCRRRRGRRGGRRGSRRACAARVPSGPDRVAMAEEELRRQAAPPLPAARPRAGRPGLYGTRTGAGRGSPTASSSAARRAKTRLLGAGVEGGGFEKGQVAGGAAHLVPPRAEMGEEFGAMSFTP